MNRKTIYYASAFFAATTLLCLVLVGSDSGMTIRPTEGTGSDYALSFTSGTNKLATGAYDGTSAYSGTGTAISGLGTSISFDYASFYNPASAWQKIQAGGYFTNTIPIHGLKSVALTKADTSASFIVYWSATPTFVDINSTAYDTTSALSVTCTFGDSYPNYLKVVATTDSTISNATITFDCANHQTLGSSFYLGKYPQTLVEDTTLLTALDTAKDNDSDGYLEYGNQEYQKITATPYVSGSYKSVSGTTTFVDQTTYYFKVEPIQWRVLSGKTASTGLVMAEKILTHGDYLPSTTDRTIDGTTIYSNNYQYSNLRCLLNGYDGSAYGASNSTNKGFIDVAFNAAEKACIKTTTVDNSAATTDTATNTYVCPNTNDKLFALSYQDLINTSHGFKAAYYSSDTNRKGYLTDYARATGAWMNSDGSGSYWSRSPANNKNDIVGVLYSGSVFNSSNPANSPTNNSIRPAFTVNLG
jgi:hypothetical protein